MSLNPLGLRSFQMKSVVVIFDLGMFYKLILLFLIESWSERRNENAEILSPKFITIIWLYHFFIPISVTL